MEDEVFDCSESTLPWSWVIEALAKSPLMDSTLLCELVSKAPPLLGDLGEKSREAVALRCLDNLCGHPTVTSESHVDPDWSKIGFDPADSCEAVLQRVLNETSGPKDVTDELKCNVQSFVKHKKASLPKSTLELLKDKILEDTHPFATSFKEVSGLDVRDQCVLNIPFDGGDPTSPPLRSDEDEQGDKTMLAEENGSSPRSDVDDQLKQPAFFRNGISLSCKVGISSPLTDNHVQEIEATSHDLDYQCPPRKKFKLYKEYTMQSKQQKVLSNNGDRCLEEIDNAMKNPSLLSSQRVFTGDSLGMTETQPNLCMKCNKDGQLLSCSARSCPLLFHESCLGSSTSFDDQGNFYCPFCAYSRAITEYVRAKEKVSLARKELSLFIGGRTGDRPEHDGDTSSGDDVNHDKHKIDGKAAELKNGANVFTGVAIPDQRSSGGIQRELSQSSAFMNVNRFAIAAQQLSLKDRQGAEMFIQFSRNPSAIWNQGQDGHGCDGVKLPSENNKLKNLGEITRCKITELHEDASSESISDSMDSDGPVRNTRPLPFPRPISSIPTRSSLYRRKKVHWSAEEEAMLKKGVEMFDQGDGRAIPWKHILEYGESVFQKGRTAIDLKDKWRNITRGTNP